MNAIHGGSMQGEYDDAFGSCQRTFATLRIYSDTVGPEAMQARLGLEPTGILKKGRKKVRYDGSEKVDRFNAFFLSSEEAVTSLDLRRHLDWLLAKLAGQPQELLALIREGEVRASIGCLWWLADGTEDGGPVLRADQLAEIAELELELVVDFTFLN